MQSIHTLLPNHETLLELEPEELAGIILEYLNSGGTKKRRMFSRSNLTSGAALRDYPRESESEIRYALAEAWIWLENQGLVAPDPSQNGGWFFITRRGLKLENATDVEAYRKANLLPKELLHPTMVDKVWPLFLRGTYDTAVFQAFKEVEVTVRETGGYTKEDRDARLMEKAFHPDTGKLTDVNQTEDEKKATLALFTSSLSTLSLKVNLLTFR